MKKMSFGSLVALLFMLILFAGCNQKKNDLEPVKDFKLDSYLGNWYEIARFDHTYERGCSNVMANYSKNDDGTVKVKNSCISNGKHKESIGEAKFQGPADVGYLKVSFYKPFYGDYKIVYLDKEYSRAIVVSSDYDSIWILSRTPKMDSSELENMIFMVEKMGFNSSLLLFPDQSKNADFLNKKDSSKIDKIKT